MPDNRNWAGNYRYSASEIMVPDKAEQVQEIVARSRRIKALGTRHSFNGIADSESLLSLEKLNRVKNLDRERNLVTVEGGIRYGDLCRYLHQNGYALPNLASLPHITVAGACATATHGSGNRNGNLATAVRAMKIVRADGEEVMYTREQPDGGFAGAVVNLGGLGIVTELTLEVSPTFDMSQVLYEGLSLDRLETHLEEIFGYAYSVSLFTDWRDSSFHQVWIKRKHADAEEFGKPGPEFYGARLATETLHPLPGCPAENCSEQLGIPGPWHERMPHFRMEFTPSVGDELQSEFFVPRAQAYEALCAVNRLREQIAPLLHASEIRTIAADDLWMSPCYKQDSAGIHFTWKPDSKGVEGVLPLIEEALAPFGARPHWGKLFTMSPARLQPLYEKLPDFRKLLRENDPEGKFRNAYLNEYIGAL
ncbi:FAD-binding protein [Paenibacillus aurantius]|uniref:FAD-binding protein n=1 Tax=Paenibacillus aurantius TaxID=2918900 RepID=A0AA96LCL6_9BACL|nr:FAD-binding protein [Paenibacillus aurantius]WNQ10718.1 FAD-binding protein [Paenibacillus aurantius]